MIAHHTLGGCNLRPGDLLASGTISGSGPGKAGCLFEATSAGRQAQQLRAPVAAAAASAGQHPPPTQPLDEPGDTEAVASRVYLEDCDEVVMTGVCAGGGAEPVSFGECRGKLLPARQL